MDQDKVSSVLSKDEVLLKKLIDIILANLENEQFGVNELSSEIGLSRSQLHRKLRMLLDKSVSQFIREVRLEEATKLLLNDVGTSSEISYKVGFSSPAYFSKCFHDCYGFPPGETKSKLKANHNGQLTLIRANQHIELLNGNKRRVKRIKWEKAITAALFICIFIALAFFYHSKNQIKSIAILPLTNLSESQNQDFILDGLHEGLISELGKLNSLKVISKPSVSSFANSEKSSKEIAGNLGVDAIIRGSMISTEDSFKIQLQLFGTFPFERELWSDRYSQDFTNILNVYKNVSKDIAGLLNIELTPVQENKLTANKIINPETYKSYVRGMYFLNKSTPDDFKKGMEYLQKAIEYDPADPLAYAGLALGYAKLGHGPDPSRQVWKRGKAAALQAIKLDSTLAEAHVILAFYKNYYDWDWEGAEKAFIHSIAINPNLAISHFHYAWHLAIFGRYDEAIREHRMAKELDPLTAIYTADMGSLYLWAGDIDKALIEATQALELDADFGHGWWVLGNAYSSKGMYEEAIEAHKKASEINPVWSWALGCTYAMSGDKKKALKILSDLESADISPRIAFGIALLYSSLGDIDEAFNWLDRKPPDTWIPWLRTWPNLDLLRDDSRFNKIMKKIDLPPV